MTKALYQLEMKLSGTLLDDLSAEASTASIRIAFKDSDDLTTSRTPNSNTKLYIIDPKNTLKYNVSEVILCSSHSTSNGVTTLSTVTRGLQRDHTIDLTGSSSRAQAWPAGTAVAVATIPYNDNLIKAYFEGTEQIPGNIDIGGTLEVDGVVKFNDQVQLSATDTYLDKVGSDMVFKDPNNPLTTLSELTAAAGTDTKARVSNNDTTSGFLNGKLVAGEGVIFTENNDGGNETLTISAPSTTNYAVDAAGNDTYVVTLSPPITSYYDGQSLAYEAGTANTDAATVNFNSLGALPIKKGDYADLVTGDILEDQKIVGLVSVKAVTFNAALLVGATSGTLSSNWGFKTGVYSVVFSNGDRRDVTLTKGATSATWSGGLSGGATANANAQWYQMMSPTASLNSGTENSAHWHDAIKNFNLARRHEYRAVSTLAVASGGSVTINNGALRTVQTQALNNSSASFTLGTTDYGSTSLSVHDKSPAFSVGAYFTASTNQEGFIGFVRNTFSGTSLENSVLTLSHIGFILEDGTLYISVGNGTSQSKTSIAVAVPSVTTGHIYEASFDGTTATFKVDFVTVGTLSTNVPSSNLNQFCAAVIADASNSARTLLIMENGIISWNI